MIAVALTAALALPPARDISAGSTPGCVTWQEMQRVDLGQTWARVARITGARGTVVRRTPTRTIRVYPMCGTARKVMILHFSRRTSRVVFGATNWRGWSA